MGGSKEKGSHISGENVQWYNTYGRQSNNISQNYTCMCSWVNNFPFGKWSYGSTFICEKRLNYKIIHCSIVCSNKILQAIQLLGIY